MYDIVVPTLGRPSLSRLLRSLARAEGPLPGRVFVVDDRPDRSAPLSLGDVGELEDRVEVVRGPAAGPAAARNRGWFRSRAPWIAFLDDDVVVEPAWRAKLAADLAACGPDTAGSQGRVAVPLPAHRKPTDWERNVRGLESGRWITADCAYRRDELRAVDGFDERFPRAYREDADLGLRIVARGKTIALGSRRVDHPVRPAGPWISVRLQAGNADDVLMTALHGRDWRRRAGAPAGRFRAHALTAACALLTAGGGAVWGARTLRFAWERIAPGPRDAREVATMLATSAVVPLAAVYYRLRADAGVPRLLARVRRLPGAVLFDRDGTLIVDDPALAEPRGVRLIRGARRALDRLRAAGIAVGVVTNQARVGEGALGEAALAAIHARLRTLAGPLDVLEACTHRRDAGCACRKPQPGLVFAAAEQLGFEPRDCVVVGDIGSDIEAARAAGARSVLVPTAVTRAEEIAAAPLVARDLPQAVRLILDGRA